MIPDPSSHLSAKIFPPESNTATVNGRSPTSYPFASATSIMVEAKSRVSLVLVSIALFL
jgi:hypothetical protein